jgi:hypothetical protein
MFPWKGGPTAKVVASSPGSVTVAGKHCDKNVEHLELRSQKTGIQEFVGDVAAMRITGSNTYMTLSGSHYTPRPGETVSFMANCRGGGTSGGNGSGGGLTGGTGSIVSGATFSPGLLLVGGAALIGIILLLRR